MFYVLINQQGITAHEVNEMITLKMMQNLVGVEGEPACIEVASYRSYSDKSIVMICDDEFLRKDYNPTCYTIEGNIIHGQVLVLGIDKANEDFGLLTLAQVEIVKGETKLCKKR